MSRQEAGVPRLRSGVFLVFITAAAACAQTTVQGTVTGADGRPMRMANVFLVAPNEARAVSAVEAGRDGRFVLHIESTGIWMLQFTGVGCREHRVALFLDHPQTILLDVQLESYRYLSDLSKATITGDFNRWNILSAVPMRKQQDGTYAARVATKADTVAYRLNNVRKGDAVEGTQADRYVPSGTGSYVSIVEAKAGSAMITFDPRRLLRTKGKARVAFGQAGPGVARFAAVHDELQRYQDSYMFAFEDAIRSGNRKDFNFKWSGPMSSVEQEIKKETHPAVREELLLNGLTLAMMAKATDEKVYRSSVEGISPASRVWSLNPHSMFFALGHSGLKEDEQDRYIQHVLDENPVDRTKSAVLLDAFMVAKLSDKKDKADRYFNILVGQFGGSPEATTVRDNYSPSGK